jgi:hypothetical protein
MALTDLLPSSVSQPITNATASDYNPLNMVADGRGILDTLTNKFILKPASAKGLAGFIFDYEGDTTIYHVSEITDHYSEQNSFMNDQAARKPARIILRGFVAELSQSPNLGVLGAINALQSKLTTLPAILGKYTPSAVQKLQALTTTATNVVNTVDNYIARAQNVVGLFVGASAAPTKQQKAYRSLYALWANNTVFTLDTPFNYFRSVMIESMSFTQDETTKQWAEIQVTVKEVRFAGVVVQGPGMNAQLAAQTQLGRSEQDSQNPTNKGKTQGIFSSFGSHIPGGF